MGAVKKPGNSLPGVCSRKEGGAIDLYLYLFMGGIALAISLIVYRAIGWLRQTLSPWQRRLQSLSYKPKKWGPNQISKDDLMLLGGCLGGMLFALMLAWGNSRLPAACFVGAGTGVGLVKFIQKNIEASTHMKKLREIAVLSETIDFLTQVKYSIPQALTYGWAITPTIRPQIERCIAGWPSGPVRALNRFAEEVNLPEAATLTSVLTHAQESGPEYARAAIEEESKNLESLRQTLAEISIVSKPVYFAIYRAMPLAAIVGIAVGPMIYRLTRMMGSVFGF